MGIYEFNILSEHDKYDTVFTKGQFVDAQKSGELKFVLYAISKFWVEVTYDVADNKIIKIGSFITGKALDKYSNIPKEL